MGESRDALQPNRFSIHPISVGVASLLIFGLICADISLVKQGALETSQLDQQDWIGIFGMELVSGLVSAGISEFLVRRFHRFHLTTSIGLVFLTGLLIYLNVTPRADGVIYGFPAPVWYSESRHLAISGLVNPFYATISLGFYVFMYEEWISWITRKARASAKKTSEASEALSRLKSAIGKKKEE